MIALTFTVYQYSMILLLFVLLSIALYIIQQHRQEYQLMHSIAHMQDYHFVQCVPGIYGSANQLQWTVWQLDNVISIPIYSTHDLDLTDQYKIENIVIIQHGNLRNANNYFCAGLESLSGSFQYETYAVIAPQFLIQGDNCWDNGVLHTVTDNFSCGLPTWTSEGWKDGLFSTNEKDLNGARIYSYDVLNALISRVGNPKYFPSVRRITLFGFSAGAQMLQRYAVIPRFSIDNIYTSINYVISDPSTFLYLDNRRPYANTPGFGIPDGSWLQAEWNRDAITNAPWITTWDKPCSAYNEWRYGFEDLNGYAKNYFATTSITTAVAAYGQRNVLYLMGTKDSCNCKLAVNDKSCEDLTGRCQDNDMATYCQGMLQGSDRLDRMKKWMRYLEMFYGRKTHNIYFANGIPHDPVLMLGSVEAKCILFNVCPEDESQRGVNSFKVPSRSLKGGNRGGGVKKLFDEEE